jgi:hypothetical protein
MKIVGVILIALAIVIAVVPQFLDCQSQGRAITLADGRLIPMKCHWTAVAEIALGVPLVGLGALLALSKRRETRRALGVVGAMLGAFAILLPAALIGVCAMNEMLCNSVMQPTLILAGALVMVISLGAFGFSFGGKEVEPA